jgi:PAS domain S-box-containing protein
MAQDRSLTGVERFLRPDDVIVSKTDTKGRITYANRTFLSIAGYTESEVMGAPHSIVRHPDVPRCVFKLLWDTISTGSEIFAYVLNRSKNGDHYWVFAHVTPSYNADGQIIGYHSNRRAPKREAIEKVAPLYAQLLAEEKRHTNDKEGLQASFGMVVDLLRQNGVSYEQFVFSL